MSLRHALERQQLQTEAELVQGLTRIPDGPFRPMLARLFDAGFQRLHYVLSPAGDSFGVSCLGVGLTFAATAAAELSGLTVPAVGERFLNALSGLEAPTTSFELTLGRSPRLASGVAINHPDQARALLARDGVPTPEIDRVLSNIGAIRAVHLWASPDRSIHWVVWGRRPRSSALGPAASLGERDVFTGEVTGRPDLTWVQRDGLPNLELVDWLAGQGFRGDYAARLGRVHAQLEASEPARMRFRTDDLPGTLTLHYRSR